MKYICITLLFLFAYSLRAQFISDSLIINARKIDLQNIKILSNSYHSKSFNCDSMKTGTTIEELYCANMKLQKQDSLLHCKLDIIINECISSGDTSSLQEILLTQEIWERYRYAHCSNCVIDKTRVDRILFVRCASELTIKRREDIEKMCGY